MLVSESFCEGKATVKLIWNSENPNVQHTTAIAPSAEAFYLVFLSTFSWEYLIYDWEETATQNGQVINVSIRLGIPIN